VLDSSIGRIKAIFPEIRGYAVTGQSHFSALIFQHISKLQYPWFQNSVIPVVGTLNPAVDPQAALPRHLIQQNRGLSLID
jgi:hypothetical protein